MMLGLRCRKECDKGVARGTARGRKGMDQVKVTRYLYIANALPYSFI